MRGGYLPFEGSSPLTRGKLAHDTKSDLSAGLIPAHAGKTAACETNTVGQRAHPRSRGENPVARSSPSLVCGSSPLTRGKRAYRSGEDTQAGLIPAHAGKTARARARIASIGAHPRSRGENPFSGVIGGRRKGSSPLTRGKQLVDHIVRNRDRLIPAHAGKTGITRTR